jgi:ABC-2 type transport system permease protein
MKTFYWLLRREFWEHRAIVIAPIITGVVILIGALTRWIIQPAQDPTVDPEKLADVALLLMSWFALPFFIVNGFVAIFYLMDSLYGERKDRSVLFWRSLPVSDTAVVTAKLTTGLVLAPLVAALVAALSLPVITFVFRGYFAGQHFSALPIMWNPAHFFQAMILWVYATAVCVLWFLPVAAWFLAVSAWAPKNPFLWGLVPPAALIAIERLLRGSSWVGDQLSDRLQGWVSLAFDTSTKGVDHGVKFNGGHVHVPANLLDWIDPRPLLASPRLWVGIAVGLLFVFLAVQGRRYRTEA